MSVNCWLGLGLGWLGRRVLVSQAGAGVGRSFKLCPGKLFGVKGCFRLLVIGTATDPATGAFIVAHCVIFVVSNCSSWSGLVSRQGSMSGSFMQAPGLSGGTSLYVLACWFAEVPVGVLGWGRLGLAVWLVPVWWWLGSWVGWVLALAIF